MSDEARDHPLIDDTQGIAFGAFCRALCLRVLTFNGLFTGQTAGLAVILSYFNGWSFGQIFFVVNLPFYGLALRRFGCAVTLKSLLSVSILSALTELLSSGFAIERLTPGLGALIFGALTGMGLLALFRHGGSLGGIGVVALIGQDGTGFRAGYVQPGFDLLLFAAAAFVFLLPVVL